MYLDFKRKIDNWIKEDSGHTSYGFVRESHYKEGDRDLKEFYDKMYVKLYDYIIKNGRNCALYRTEDDGFWYYTIMASLKPISLNEIGEIYVYSIYNNNISLLNVLSRYFKLK
jgi:hypothetical protein